MKQIEKKVGNVGISCSEGVKQETSELTAAFKTMVKTHFSSLSSRNVSFFCFLISSKLRRASARSLTARSLSRRRLSHRVL